VLSAPFLGSASVPPRVKGAFAVLLTIFLVPLIPMPATGRAAPAVAALLGGEFAIGFLLGFTLQLLFDGAQLAGQICGTQMGYSLASVLNPDSQADSTVLSTLYQLTVLLLFIQLSVPQWLLRGLARSFDYCPPGQFSLTWPATSAFFNFASGMWVAGVQIAAPVLVASLFSDVALGFLGKASPQFPVLFLGISLKNLLGLGLLIGAVTFWPRFFDARFERALEASERILKLAH
jgi:flagellar biosynthesis protein FliR